MQSKQYLCNLNNTFRRIPMNHYLQYFNDKVKRICCGAFLRPLAFLSAFFEKKSSFA